MKKILFAILCIVIISCIPPGEPQPTVEPTPEETPAPEPVETPAPEPEPEELEEEKEVSINVELYLKSKYAQVEVNIDEEKESFILKTISEDEIITEISTKYELEEDTIKNNISFDVKEKLEEEKEAEPKETSIINPIIKKFNSKVVSYRYVKEDPPFLQSSIYVRGPKIKAELKQPFGTEYFDRRAYARDEKEEVRRKAREGEEYFVNLFFLDKDSRNAKGICTAFDLYTSCEWIEGVVQKLPWKEFNVKTPGDWLMQFKDTEPTKFIEAGGYVNGVDTNQLVFEQGTKTTRIWTHVSFGIPQQVEVEIGDSRTRIVFKNMIINSVTEQDVEDPMPYNPED